MKRRGNREGSVFQRADGRWCAELYMGRNINGGKKVTRYYGATRTAVQEKLTDAAGKHQRGVLPDPSKDTVEKFLERWLRDSAKHSVRPRTFECYAGSLRTHAIPVLGRKRLTKLAPGDLRSLYAAKLTEGLAPRTVQLLHAILRRALKQAARDGLTARNVAELVDRPRAPRRTMKVLTPTQVAAFLGASRADRLHALYVLAVTCGCRQGELLGLSWPRVDLEEAAIEIVQQLQYIRGEPGPSLSEPKSAAGPASDRPSPNSRPGAPGTPPAPARGAPGARGRLVEPVGSRVREHGRGAAPSLQPDPRLVPAHP
jgi:hypothetical protein